MIAFDPVDSDRFMAEDDGASVVMLNLLRLRPDRGRDRYLEHLSMAGPLAARQGAEIIYAGDGLAPLAAEPGQDWHAAAQVRHPSRRAFAALLADPDHHAPDPVRLSALAEAVLQPMRAMGA